MKNFIITSITSSLLGTLITLCFITYYKPYPKIGRVYQQINTNPFDTHIVKNSIIDIKGDYVQFIEYIDDTIQPGKPSCKIKDFLTNNKLIK